MLLLEEFEKYVAQNELFGHDDKILLTVSGGVDSMVMMSLFAASGYRFGVAHCNFQLRGQESDEDEALVAEQARRYGVELFNRRFDTQGEMERTGESMEMAARRLRYTWFRSLCDEHGYNVIAIAHHINDSIETFFINMLRGTGLRGLTGISVQAGRIVRPLMFATRKDILDYATAHRIPYREDSSNRSTKYLRNKVRLGIVPMLREINPQFTTVMRRNISRLTDAQTFIDRSVELIRRDAMTEQGGLYTLHVDRIDASLPLGYVVYEILNSMFGFKGDTVDALCHALQQNNTGRRFYSREWVATIDRGRIVIGRIADEDTCMTQVEQGVLRSYCGSSVLHYEYCDIDMIDSVTTPDNVALVDADKLRFPLTLRRWQQGDWFVPFGMSGRKKVSDFLIDAKVSMAEKSRQFVLLSGDDVVWLVGRRADDRFRLTRQTENVLKITREIL
ncbi:MAG: tRNA lysidine(34) synthetase TilS [Alistipes sp.]|jgi:tRNA(Ile)-lysidine synthase|nr:tRNA lysidine(34) synthetase TilS [Alistipes sp.]